MTNRSMRRIFIATLAVVITCPRRRTRGTQYRAAAITIDINTAAPTLTATRGC